MEGHLINENIVVGLRQAVRFANVDEVKRLLATGIDVNDTKQDENLFIRYLASLSPVEIMDNRFFDYDSRKRYDRTIDDNYEDITSVTRFGYYNTVEKVVRRKEIQENKAQILELLLNAGGRNVENDGIPTPFIIFCNGGTLHLAKILLEKGMVSDKEKNEALEFGLRSSDIRLVKILIDEGINLQGKMLAMCQQYPFEKCGSIHRTQLVDMLIEHGVMIDELSDDGKSPLICAIETCQDDIASLLIKKGAHLDIIDNHGNIALSLTRKKGNIRLMKELIEAGANPPNVEEYKTLISEYDKKYKDSVIMCFGCQYFGFSLSSRKESSSPN